MSFFSSKKSPKNIYLDYAGSTPATFQVTSAPFAHPSSLHHAGLASKRQLADARERIARSLDAHPDEIAHTSGGGAGNMAIVTGVLRAFQKHNPTEVPQCVISPFEHPSLVYELEYLANMGKITLDYLPLDTLGLVDTTQLGTYITEKTALVSVLHIHNETGAMQPIGAIAKHIRRTRKDAMFPVLHSDMSQSLMVADISMRRIHVDYATYNGAKCYGPHESGAIFVRRGAPFFHPQISESQARKEILPIASLDVGKHEAFSHAVEDAQKKTAQHFQHYAHMRSHVIAEIQQGLHEMSIDGDHLEVLLYDAEQAQTPGILLVACKHLSSERMVLELDALGVQASSHTACKQYPQGVSPGLQKIVRAQGIEWEEFGTIRFSFGKETTQKDAITAGRKFIQVLKKMYSEHAFLTKNKRAQ